MSSELKEKLIKELKKGEESGFVKDFDRKSFLNGLHQKLKLTCKVSKTL